ncbi:MAG: DUF3181 family protein [Thermosynechococcaceae cyanobacterium]
MANTLASEDIEALAAEIGQSIYIDVAKWHLYLTEAHLDTVLAERFAPMLLAGEPDEGQVMQVLSDISVQVGGGKRELPLTDLLPAQCQVNLMDLLADFQQRL